MVVFREKIFFLPVIGGALKAIGLGSKAMGAVTVGSTGISAVQGHKANKIATKQGAEMAEQQRRQAAQMAKQQAQQTKLLEQQTQAYKKSLKEATKNGTPIAPPTQSEFSITLKRKTFANPVVQGITNIANRAANSGAWKKFKKSKTGENIIGFGKDLTAIGKKRGSGQKIANMISGGATMAAGGYLVDKAIQADAKKSGIPINSEGTQEKKKSGIVKKALLGTGAAAGTLLLARKGKLNTQTFKKGSKMLGEGFKEQFRLKDPKTGKKNILGPVITVGIPAMTGISYLAQKKQMKDQVEQTEKQYSSISIGKKLAGAGRKLVDVPAAIFGFGRKERKKLGNQFLSQAKISGNPITQKMAKIVNPKKAILGTGAGVLIGSAAFKPFDIGDKAVRKSVETVDKKAYGYEKQQNQKI